MKKKLPVFAVLIYTAMIFNACSASKSSVTAQKSDVENAKEASTACFVQFNDGSVQQYTTLKLVTGLLITPHLLADDKVIINSKDILAYQDSRYYAVSNKMLTSKKTGLVAEETLPGFAVRVLSGKVNVYCRKFYNGSNTADEYFLQHGNDGYIIAFSGEVLKTLLKENKKALEYFNSHSKISPRSKKMLETIEMYNTGQFITKN